MAIQKYTLIAGDWLNLEFIINDLSARIVDQPLLKTSTPTFAGGTITGDLDIGGDAAVGGDFEVTGSLTLSGLTASRLVQTDADVALVSVANLANWIAGTTNRITVTDDTDGTVTLSLPQDIHTTATPRFAGLGIGTTGQTGKLQILTGDELPFYVSAAGNNATGMRFHNATDEDVNNRVAIDLTCIVDVLGMTSALNISTGFNNIGETTYNSIVEFKTYDTSVQKTVLTIDGKDFNFGTGDLLTSGTLGAGAITGTSFIIGANTLNGTEWGYLDGQNQALKTTDDVTFDVGTFTEVNIGQVGSNALTKLAVGLTVTPTYAFPAYIEMITTPANPANVVMQGIYSEISHSASAMPANSGAGFYFNTSSGDIKDSGTILKQVIGLFGGSITAFTNTVANSAGRNVTLYGLYFNVYNAANWQPTASSGLVNKIIITEGLFINSNLGYTGYIISGAKAQGISYGANINSILAGTYGASGQVPAAGLNYGAYIATTDSLTDAWGNITSYALYVSACAGSTKASGGIITSYGIYETGGAGSINILGNNTRIGGLTAPTVACDVTGAILASTSITATTGFGCNSKAAQTAYASGGAVATAAGAFGFSADSERAALTTLVANIRLALVANGIMS